MRALVGVQVAARLDDGSARLRRRADQVGQVIQVSAIERNAGRDLDAASSVVMA